MLPALILLIVADDLNMEDIAQAQTPTIDWMASVGCVYTRHHGEAACSISRASLLTGELARDHLVGGILFPKMDWSADLSGSRTLPRLVHGRSVYVGKWHVGSYDLHPLDAGYAEWWGTLGNLGKEDYFGWTEVHDGTETYRTDYLTSVQGGRVLAEVLKGTEFIHWGPHAIHEPEHWPPQNLWTPGAPDERAAMLEALDTVMGRVVHEAYARGYTIIFAADNGGKKGDGKSTLYESALRVPLIVVGKNIPSGLMDGLTTWRTVRRWVSQGWDMGVEDYQVHDRFPGVGMFKAGKWDRSVNDDRWKLIVQDGGRSEEFYDLWQDPNETVNLFPNLSAEQRAAYVILRTKLP